MSEPKTTTTAVDPVYRRLPTVGNHAARIGSVSWRRSQSSRCGGRRARVAQPLAVGKYIGIYWVAT